MGYYKFYFLILFSDFFFAADAISISIIECIMYERHM